MTGDYFMDGASKYMDKYNLQFEVTPWQGEKMTVQDIRDKFNKMMGGDTKEKQQEHIKYLEEELKRAQSKIKKQRKELKRLNKQLYRSKILPMWELSVAAKELFKLGSIESKGSATTTPLNLIKGKDNMGQACTKYGCAGTYVETNLMDDKNGILHCSWCNQEVKRYQ